MIRASIVLNVTLFGLLASTARAEPAPEPVMGTAGNVVITGNVGAFVSRESYDAPEGEPPGARLKVSVQPGVDYFVTSSLTIGGEAAYIRESTDDRFEEVYGFGPRIGYHVQLSRRASLWPTALLFYAASELETDAFDSISISELTGVVFAPFLFHPAPHFFFGGGPFFVHSFWVEVDDEPVLRYTRVGVSALIGGWF